LDFSPNGRYLVSASFDSLARLWEVTADGLAFVQNFAGHEKPIYSITFSENNQNVATASYDGQVGLFTIGEKQGVLFRAHGDRVHSVDFDSSGQLLVTSSRNGSTRVWYVNSQWVNQRPAFNEIDKVNSAVMWATFSPNNRYIAIAQRNQLIKIYDMQQQKLVQTLTGHEETIHRAIFSPDNAQLVTASGDTTVRFWDLETQQALFNIQLPAKKHPNKTELWDMDFQCYQGKCLLAVPLTQGELILYDLGTIY
jgi:WD40 repeat protein